MHQTRSGRNYKPAYYYGVRQSSSWGQLSDVLTDVLPLYLAYVDVLSSRAVCQAWRTAFSALVTRVLMKQPKSEAAARCWGRKAAAAFPNTAKIRLELYHADPCYADCFDLTGSSLVYNDETQQLLRPRAAAALLRPFRSLSTLTTLQLDCKGEYACLNTVLPALPQLRHLDLRGCRHVSRDLVVIAKYLQQLEELLLCSNHRVVVKYKPGDIAALSSLPQLERLQLLVVAAKEDIPGCWSALGMLTHLTSLHVLGHRGHRSQVESVPLDVVRSLSTLTRLRSLKAKGGTETWQDDSAVAGRHWTAGLQGLTALQKLELDDIIITDTLLLGLSTHQLLQKVILSVGDWGVKCEVTDKGADAVAHVPHIELTERKGVECNKVKPLLQLPSFKRYRAIYLNQEIQGWSPLTCICNKCWFDQPRNQWRQHRMPQEELSDADW